MIRIAEPLTALSHELLAEAHELPGRERGGGAARCSSSAGRPARAPGFNAVPGSAWFSIDRRFNPEEDLDEELARLTGMVERGGRRPPAPR